MTRSAPVAVVAAAILVATPAWGSSVVVQFGTAMRYKANAANPGIGLAWTAEGYDDALWANGSYGVGYETSTGAQNLLQTTVPAGTLSIYTRARFTLADASAVQGVFLAADYDDGYVAWINGVEVYRSPQMPAGSPAWNTIPASHESSNGQTPAYGASIDVSALALPVLHDGVNVLAVGVWNTGSSSSDLVLVPQLVLDTAESGPALVRGPYLQMRTPTSLVVRWRTDSPTDGVVRFGNAPWSLTSSVSHPQPLTEHILTLSGLEPNTRYFYTVGSSSSTMAGGDPDHTFVTAPPPHAAQSRRIWVLGDSGRADANVRAVRDAYADYVGDLPTDLWLMLGDNAYVSGTDLEYQAAVFEMFPSTLRASVLWPTFGNHDAMSADAATQSGPYFDIFSLPSAAQAGGIASQTEAYYAFDDGNVHFVVLDSSESSRAAGSPMLTWLQQDLAANTQDWTVAFWHHPPYSKGSHNSDTEIELMEMRQNALPILEAGGVDLVLCGHSHAYERSYFIDGHYGLSTSFSAANIKNGGDGRPGGDGPYTKAQMGPHPHQGTVYVVAGTSGRADGGTLDHPAMFTSLSVLGSLVLDVLGNRLDATFIDDAATVRDSFTIIKGSEIAPDPDFFAFPTTGTAPLSVSFTDRSTNSPSSWVWDFQADGTTESAVRNPSYMFNAPGLYSVKLTSSNGAGGASVTKPALVCVVSGSPVAGVTHFRVASDHQTLSWDAQPLGTTYDLVRGDLQSLATSGGDFTASIQTCLVPGGAPTSFIDGSVPGPGAGLYYVVRARDCSGAAGSYNEGGSGQTGSRDTEIAGSSASCH